MNTVVVELFVHPWWVDVLVVSGMITLLVSILIAFKKAWNCASKRMRNDNDESANTVDEAQDEWRQMSVPMTLTQAAIDTAEELGPPVILGGGLDVILSDDVITDVTDFDTPDDAPAGGPDVASARRQGSGATVQTRITRSSSRASSAGSRPSRSRTSSAERQWAWQYFRGQDPAEVNAITAALAEQEQEESAQGKGQANRHAHVRGGDKANPSLGGVMTSIDGLMSRLRTATLVDASTADGGDSEPEGSLSLSLDEFGTDSALVTDDSVANESGVDICQKLKLVGASSFLLKRLESAAEKDIQKESSRNGREIDNDDNPIMFGKIDEYVTEEPMDDLYDKLVFITDRDTSDRSY